jgi:hypothetical protein
MLPWCTQPAQLKRNVHRARLLDEVGDLRIVHHVQGRRLDSLGQAPQQIRVDVGRDDPGALAGEGEGGGAAHAWPAAVISALFPFRRSAMVAKLR